MKYGLEILGVYEKRILELIYEKYLGSSLTQEEEMLVKAIDDDMLYFDLRELLGEVSGEKEPEMKSKFSFEFVPFIEVEKRYLNEFSRLYPLGENPKG